MTRAGVGRLDRAAIARDAVRFMDPFCIIARSATGRSWQWRAQPLPLGAAQRLGVDDLAAQLLLSRGCAPDDVGRTLRPTLRDWMPDPSLFLGMDLLSERLADAVQRRERIILFADYDVDGATSAAFLLRLLRSLGADAGHYVPDRLLEGYGPSAAALSTLKSQGADLVVLLDCGTQAFGPLEAAAADGLDLLIVDHHKASPALPPAIALVNPNRLDESAEAASYGHLCTAGLAFLVGAALNRVLRQRGFFADRQEPRIADWLDIVALGTVADVVPLHGLNRAFVALGLRRMAQRQTSGMVALADVAGLQRPPGADDLGFQYGPRINAGGRVGKADLGLRLLATDDPADAAVLAAALDNLNQERRAIEAEVTQQALALAGQQPDTPVTVVAAEGWHPGVVGIVAARLKERLHRPAIILSIGQDGVAKGSGRSVEGVDLGAAVLAAKDRGLISEGGGHAMACGVTVPPGGIPAFARFLCDMLGERIIEATAERRLAIDLSVAPAGLTPALVDALDAAAPYGQGWPRPRIAIGPVRIVQCRRVGKEPPGDHLRIVGAGPDGGRVEAIAFRAADTPLGAFLLTAGDQPLMLAGRAQRNEWQGRISAQLQLDDAAPAG